MTVTTSHRGARAISLFAMIPALFALVSGLPFGEAPARAQFSDSYKFLQAVRKQDGETVVKYVEVPGTTLINTRDNSTGETALLITIGRQDAVWTRYLLAHGARSDIAAADGRLPLMLAVEKRFTDGIELLLKAGADVNQANRGGETALIRAVQMRNLPIIRLLIAGGADPDKPDALAGMSARDYAVRDARDTAILSALEEAEPKTVSKRKVQGPGL